MMKRDVYAALASASLIGLAAATYAEAEDVGCCQVECRGPNTVGVRLDDAKASECGVTSKECVATWSAEPCPKGEGPGVPGAGFGSEVEDEAPAR